MKYLSGLTRWSKLFLFSFLVISQASSATQSLNKCDDLLSRQSVRDRYASLVKLARKAPGIMEPLGIQNQTFINDLLKVSFLTGTAVETLGRQALEVTAIKSPAGIPDGDEISSKALTQILYLSSSDVHLMFQHTIDFVPLLEGKVASTDDAMALVKLSAIYNLTPEQTVKKLDELIAAAGPLKAKIGEINEAKLAKMDALTRSLATLAGGGSDEIPTEPALAIIESAVASKGPVEKGIKAFEQILDHESANRYTQHEQAAMLKALVLLGQSLNASVEKLAALDRGAKQLFGSGLEEAVERPAVNMILLGGQDPKLVLDMLQHVAKIGAHYDATSAALVLNKALLDLSDRTPNQSLLKSTVVIPK